MSGMPINRCMSVRKCFNTIRKIENQSNHNPNTMSHIAQKLRLYNDTQNPDIKPFITMNSKTFESIIKNYYFVGYN